MHTTTKCLRDRKKKKAQFPVCVYTRVHVCVGEQICSVVCSHSFFFLQVLLLLDVLLRFFSCKWWIDVPLNVYSVGLFLSLLKSLRSEDFFSLQSCLSHPPPCDLPCSSLFSVFLFFTLNFGVLIVKGNRLKPRMKANMDRKPLTIFTVGFRKGKISR